MKGGDPQSGFGDNPAQFANLRMIRQARTMNLIHSALQSTLSAEELERVVVATLVSHRGLGFSRAMLFRYDPVPMVFRGAVAYGAPDAESHSRLRDELREDETLQLAIRSPEQLETDWMSEELLLSLSMDDREHSEFWRPVIERYEYTDLSFVRKISGVALAMQDRRGGASESLPARLRRLGHAIQVSPGELVETSVPPALRDLLPGDSLWSLVSTPRGPRMIIIVDRIYEQKPLDEIERLHMDWFVRQLSEALDKTELYSDVRRANEQLKQIDRLKSNFLSTISHELRTPLTSISGFTRLLEAGHVGEISARQKEILQRILSQSDKLTIRVNDLIEIAEIDSGTAVDMNVEAVDPLDVYMSILPRVEHRRVGRGVTLDLEVDSAVRPILADRDRLGRILYHLLDNAIKFSSEGGRVVVTFGHTDEGEARIQVRDFGIGMAPERLNTVFTAFFQIDSDLTRVYEGLGLGLTLVSKLVSGTGGRLEVESREGEGSVFTVIYPLA